MSHGKGMLNDDQGGVMCQGVFDQTEESLVRDAGEDDEQEGELTFEQQFWCVGKSCIFDHFDSMISIDIDDNVIICVIE